MSQRAPNCVVPRGHQNSITVYRPALNIHADPRALFIGTYRRFVDACREVEEPGLAAIAVDETTGALLGVCGIRACLGRPAVAVLGRHDQCDLVLRGDDIALRHVAIVLDPVSSWAEGARAEYRVLDLRTSSGLYDETGRALRSFRADGPAVLRCGDQVIFLLPLGDPTDWPAAAANAWDMLPQRVYLDECGSMVRNRRTSMIFRTPPIPEDFALGTGDLAGTFEVQQPKYTGLVTLGRIALRDGVLIGRYQRCELGDRDPSISRVHALVLSMSRQLVIADLSSTHGIG
ncbi:MAG: FHA domain-containing protein, partial [Deltaproteobacteria bacterium]|nr:FHA domain-containing protein [Deltaproteobacteria bacterium]